MTTPDNAVGFDLVMYSNSDLPGDKFNAQVEMIKRVATFHGVTSSWHGRVSTDNMQWGAKVLNQLLRRLASTARSSGSK